MLILLFVALWCILRGDLFYILPCVILFLCFSVLLALRLPRLGKRANLSAFRTFDRFVLVWICRFPLPLGVWEGLHFVVLDISLTFSFYTVKTVREKSRECHNHKLQSILDTKRKRKQTKPNRRISNKHTNTLRLALSSPSEALQGYTLFFLFLLKKLNCGYSFEPPRRGGSNECQQSMF